MASGSSRIYESAGSYKQCDLRLDTMSTETGGVSVASQDRVLWLQTNHWPEKNKIAKICEHAN